MERFRGRRRGAAALIGAVTVIAVTAGPAAAAAPVISSFNPTSGPVGTAVTVTGDNLTGATSVRFHGVQATFTVTDDEHIQATVPAGATTGLIRVTTPDGDAASATAFVVTSGGGQPPVINSFNPASGPVGTVVTISGDNFTGATLVEFHGTDASFTVTNDNQIQATVPTGATTGRIRVTTPAGVDTSDTSFTVTTGVAPVINSFTPMSGPVGTVVTINGNHFTGTTLVEFHGTDATFSVTNDNRIEATVPAGATTGRIRVTTPGGVDTSDATFTVTSGLAPVIDSFNPTSGPVGTVVTISGNHFTGTNSVQFHGVAATFTVTSDNQIQATVPAGATSGRIRVHTPAGADVSNGVFTVTGERHRRSISLALSGHLRATGFVTALDGYNACERNVPVVIKRYRNGSWRWVATTSTTMDGRYRAVLRDRPGLYRARARRIVLVNGAICRGTRSAAHRHHH
jgi:hypothetical protein